MRSAHNPLHLACLGLLLALASVGNPLRGAQRVAPGLQSHAILRIPGRLEAEAYDEGGEGVGFRRSRSEDSRAPAARLARFGEGGTAVELLEGAWLRYTAEVQATGLYTLEFQVAHSLGDDPLFRLTCDGADLSGTLNAPYTGGLEHWVTVTRPAVALQAGRHVFRLEQIGGTPFYLDGFDIKPGTPTKAGAKPAPGLWELIWSDEFNTDGRPDASKWSYDLGGHGWGNKELQYYTDRPENARVEGGRLILEARLETHQSNRYTSARLHTRGKQTFCYGRVEVSAKLPAAMGSWPAIWMLGANRKPWPECGELDIMEHLARNPGWVHASSHCLKYFFKKGNQMTSLCYVSDATRAFHEYELEWYPDHLDFLVDNNRYLTVRNDGTGSQAWPFDDPAFLILNVALGGWGGPVLDSQLPARMEVDYVRVYKRKP